jgi:hypothetical protein
VIRAALTFFGADLGILGALSRQLPAPGGAGRLLGGVLGCYEFNSFLRAPAVLQEYFYA